MTIIFHSGIKTAFFF